jgi:hypothetical protein
MHILQSDFLHCHCTLLRGTPSTGGDLLCDVALLMLLLLSLGDGG